MAGYRIIDEPLPSGLERLATNPFWPFLASMFAGAWLAWPWFAFNAFALGSGRRFGDLALVILGLIVNTVLILLLVGLANQRTLDGEAFAYALLVPQGLRLVLLYWIYLRQERTFELFTHFGGDARNGMFVVFAGAVVNQWLIAPSTALWTLLLR
jgi:hypothetical protein